MSSITLAGNRFFRLYYKHCVSPDTDTLFNLLNATHSLNDKLDGCIGKNFYDSDEFIALKALRNLFHHQEELINEVKIIPIDILSSLTTDMLHLCLIHSDAVAKSIEGIPKKRREIEKLVINNTLKWYKTVVNINPCIFNFSVKVYEFFAINNIPLNCDEYLEFHSSYLFEEENMQDHYISGDIYSHAGNVDKIIDIVFNKTA